MRAWIRRLLGGARTAPAASPAAGAPVLTWLGGNGGYRLEVFADGRAVLHSLPGGWGGPPVAAAPPVRQLSAAELEELEALLRRHAAALAALAPDPRPPVPEERRALLEVHWRALDLRIERGSRAWPTHPATRACAAALHQLAMEVQAEGV